MRTVTPPARAGLTIVSQALLPALCGLALAVLIVRAPVRYVVGGSLGVLLLFAFLSRPDVGLLITLFVRSSTDAFLVLTGALGGSLGPEGGPMAVITPNTALILILIGVGGLYMLSRGVPLLSLPGGSIFVLLILTGFVGMLRADGLLFSLNQWLPVLSTLIVYALAAQLFRTPSRAQRVVDVIGLSFILPALFGYYQLLGGRGGFDIADTGLTRIYGTFVHPNPFGLYLVVIISVFMGQALFHSGKRRAVAILIVASALPLLIGTFARFAWVGALIVLLTFGVLRSRLLLVAIPLVAVLTVGIFPAVGVRFGDPLAGSFADRMNIWRGAFRGWLDVAREDASGVSLALNWAAGLGPGAVEQLTAGFRGRAFAAHNDYVRLLIDHGLLGLILYTALSIVLVLSAYRAWRWCRSSVACAIPLSFLALALAYPVMSITGNVFGATANQMYFWSLAGLTVALGRMTSPSDEESSGG